ncbi:MAG: type IV pilus secretin PilQ [Desulfuromusa sp.]|nr:type IV pilus secretin PilQ [Desulfuromusa sp.]
MRRSVVLLSMLLMFLSVALASPICAADSLSVVSVAEKRVQLSATAGIEQIRYFTLDSPKRLVVDMYGVQPGDHDESFNLNNGFNLLRVGPLDNKTRFVFDVAGAVFPTYKVNTENNEVVVTWERSQETVENALAEPATEGSAKITAIEFASEQGRSKVYIKVSGKTAVVGPARDGNKIQFSFKNTTLPRALRRVFDTLAFPSAIHSVTPYLVDETGQAETRFVVFLKGDVPYQLEKISSGYAFIVNDEGYSYAEPVVTGTLPVSAQGGAGTMSQSAPRLSPGVSSMSTNAQMPVPVIEQVGSQEKKYTGEKTSLVFDNADVRDILRLIAEISDLNIIASDEVKGNVTLRLIDVPWDQSLELILDVTGLGMVQEGNVVRVLPKEKIRSMKEAELTAVRSQEKLEPLVTEVVTVSYADLGSVAGPAKEILSDRGSITEDSRNKLLIVTDVPQRIEKVKELISILDTPERQVMIEARIVQVNSNYSRDLGVNWGIQGSDRDNASDNASIQGIAGAGGGFLVDVADQGSFIATPGLGTQFQFGRSLIDNVLLDMQLSALESDGNGKVVSTPRVSVLNGESATISQGTTIPYQTSGADGPKTEFVNAELKLEVTPVINPDGSIILEILATNDSPGLTAGATAPSIDTKKAETKVLIQDGETTVIGGIYVENTQDSEEGIPGLMGVPILGNLFKSQKKQTVKDELLIFITPRIMHDN